MTTANIAQSLPGFFVAGAEQGAWTPMPALRRAWGNYRTYRSALADLKGLSRRELEDIGLTPEGLKAAARTAAY